MKTVLTSLLLLTVSVLTGCSKDAEVGAFIQELDGTTKEIVLRIDSDPTAAGVEKAQKAFEKAFR